MRRWLLAAVVVLLLGGAGVVLLARPVASPVQADGPEKVPAALAQAPVKPSPSPTSAPTPLSTPTPPEPPVEASAADLDAHGRLDALVAVAEAELGQALAVTVLNTDGQIVYDHAGDQLLLPASTQKLLVAAAALFRFGPEHRYRTDVRAVGGVDSDGVVHGDLYLVGSGDPALATPTFATEVWPDRPRTPLEDLADAVVAAGVRHVSGGVLGDPSVFADEPIASGWLPRYFDELDATYASGLTVDAGRRLFVNDAGRLQGEVALDPASEAAAALLVLLTQRGVVVDGGVSTTTTPPSATTLASVESPSLAELLTHTVQHSDNHMADGIYRTLGAAAGEPTWVGSGRATVAGLEGFGLDWTGTVLADGSGLSRDNRLSSRLLAGLDAAMARSELAEVWRGFMAVAGESGTLRRRLRGTIAEGRLRGKTGTLQDVRTIAGTVDGPAGTRYHLAVFGNDLSVEQRTHLRAIQDEVVLILAEALYGCERIPLPLPTTPAPDAAAAPEPAYELVCAAA